MEIINAIIDKIKCNFNPEYPSIYRNLRYFFNSLLGRYSWYNSWGMPSYIAERMLPLLYNVRKQCHSYPGMLSSFEEWQNILDDIIFALEYYICNEHQFNPLRYRKLKKQFTKKYGWHTTKNENFKRKPCRDIIQGYFNNFPYKCNYDLQIKFEERMQRGFELMGKYFTYLYD